MRRFFLFIMTIMIGVIGVVAGCDDTSSDSSSELIDPLARAEYLMKELEGENYTDYFKRSVIADRIVYSLIHRRMIGDAIVELDTKYYEFDLETGELVECIIRWRDLPEELPDNMISQEEAEEIAGGDVSHSYLMIISPESVVYGTIPTPENPCWIVRTIEEGDIYQSAKIIDAVEGIYLGDGIPPP